MNLKSVYHLMGLEVAPNGGRVQITILTPIGAKPALTKGTDENNQEIAEQIAPVANVNRNIVSFAYINSIQTSLYIIDIKFDNCI